MVKRLSLSLSLRIVFIYVNHLRFITLDTEQTPLLLATNCPHQPGTKPTPNWKNWQRNTATTTATPAASLTETSPGNLLEFKVASFYWFW